MSFLSDILSDALRLPEPPGADTQPASPVGEVAPADVEAVPSWGDSSAIVPAPLAGEPRVGDGAEHVPDGVMAAAPTAGLALEAEVPSRALAPHATRAPGLAISPPVPVNTREGVVHGDEAVASRRLSSAPEERTGALTPTRGALHSQSIEVSHSRTSRELHPIQPVVESERQTDAVTVSGRRPESGSEGGVVQPSATEDGPAEHLAAVVRRVEPDRAESVNARLTGTPRSNSRRATQESQTLRASVVGQQVKSSLEEQEVSVVPSRGARPSPPTEAPRSQQRRAASESRAMGTSRGGAPERAGRGSMSSSPAPADVQAEPRVHIGTVQVIVSSPAPEPRPERVDGGAELVHRRYLRSL